MLKAVLDHAPAPYSNSELGMLATHCTQQEDAAQKVERQVRKSEAALVLESRIGERFDGVVTGNSEGKTWVRIFTPPTEGKLVNGGPSLKIGQQLRVRLTVANVERGFIDFVLAD